MDTTNKTLTIAAIFSIIFSCICIFDFFSRGSDTEEKIISSKTYQGKRSAGQTRFIKTENHEFTSSNETLFCCLYNDEYVKIELSPILKLVKKYSIKNENYKTWYNPEQSVFDYIILNILSLIFSILFFLIKNKNFRLKIAGLMLCCMIPNLVIWIVLGYIL